MVNTIKTLTDRNKELLNKVQELENKEKTEISKEAQLKIIDKIQAWKKENYETGDRLKKYQGNTYPSHITDNTTAEWPLWRQLAGHVNFELNMVQYLDRKENPLDALLEMMLNSITRNVVGYYSSKGLEEKEREETKKYREKTNTLEQEIAKEKRQKRDFERVSLDYLKELVDKRIEVKELNEELAEKELAIKHLEEKLQHEKLKEQTHIEAFEVSERWNKGQKAELIKEYNDCVDLLYEADDIIEDRDDTIRDLRKDLKERQELLDERDEQNEELRRQLDLERKPLPSSPKKQNKFQQLRTKIKTKFQNLVKKVKHQERELVARIETNPK